jgi:hypothetical protein
MSKTWGRGLELDRYHNRNSAPDPNRHQNDADPQHWWKASLEDTVTFFIRTFFMHNKVYTNFLYPGQSLYGTKFIR